jgi:hypothetical protein
VRSARHVIGRRRLIGDPKALYLDPVYPGRRPVALDPNDGGEIIPFRRQPDLDLEIHADRRELGGDRIARGDRGALCCLRGSLRVVAEPAVHYEGRDADDGYGDSPDGRPSLRGQSCHLSQHVRAPQTSAASRTSCRSGRTSPMPASASPPRAPDRSPRSRRAASPLARPTSRPLLGKHRGQEGRHGASASVSSVELPLLPCLDAGVVMEAGEHPAEHAQPRLPAPAVRVAVALEETRRLTRLGGQREDDIPDGHRRQEPPHAARLGPPLPQSQREGVTLEPGEPPARPSSPPASDPGEHRRYERGHGAQRNALGLLDFEPQV